jgi:hypothetical protein
MQASLFRSLARSLATLALGLSIATTPAVASEGEEVSMVPVEASTAASATEDSSSAIEGSVAASPTEGSIAVSAMDTSMEASTPFTPVMAIAATAPAITDTPATATAPIGGPRAELWRR